MPAQQTSARGGISVLSRTAVYKKKSIYKRKKLVATKKVIEAVTTKSKKVGGAKNGDTRTVQAVAAVSESPTSSADTHPFETRARHAVRV